MFYAFYCSCLLARNLLSGLKTCWDVFQYINCEEGKMSGPSGDATNSLVEGYSKVDFNSKFSVLFSLLLVTCTECLTLVK